MVKKRELSLIYINIIFDDDCLQSGARDRNRTGMEVTPQDFKSCASTNSATRALISGDPLAIRTPDPLIKSQVLYQLS